MSSHSRLLSYSFLVLKELCFIISVSIEARADKRTAVPDGRNQRKLPAEETDSAEIAPRNRTRKSEKCGRKKQNKLPNDLNIQRLPVLGDYPKVCWFDFLTPCMVSAVWLREPCACDGRLPWWLVRSRWANGACLLKNDPELEKVLDTCWPVPTQYSETSDVWVCHLWAWGTSKRVSHYFHKSVTNESLQCGQGRAMQQCHTAGNASQETEHESSAWHCPRKSSTALFYC